jgi:aspartyl protease family protein
MSDPQQSTHRIGTIMIYLACVLFLGILTLLFNDILDQRENPNRSLAGYSESGPREVVLQRNYNGHYIAPGTINGEPVLFLLDTGATDISIPGDVAEKLGLSRGRPAMVTTANGTIVVYDTLLDDVTLGNIGMHNVAAHINPYMRDDVVLLGMSFMKNLEIIQKGGQLTLRQ